MRRPTLVQQALTAIKQRNNGKVPDEFWGITNRAAARALFRAKGPHMHFRARPSKTSQRARIQRTAQRLRALGLEV